MNFKEEDILFNQLKKDISAVFLQENSTLKPDISEWKGIEIVYFQEHLLKKVKSTVSEKWFYTYFKSEFTKLPRIDMLNILCQYAGYASWSDFKNKNKNLLDNTNHSIENISNSNVKANSKKNIYKSKQFIFSVIGGIVVIIAFIVLKIIDSQNTYQFLFVDADRNTVLKNRLIEVEVLRKGFASAKLKTVDGKFSYKTYEDTLVLIANSAFHKKDTFMVNLSEYNGQENLELKQDDYAVMLYYYSRSNQDIINRKKHLENLISPNAKIYQLYDNEDFGMEPLTKDQYINLLLLPTTSLKNYALIDSEMKNGKINKIKFKIQQDETP